MLRDKLFIALFFLIVLIALLHISAIELSLYRLLWWFDVLVHFLAGLWVGGFSLWIYFRSGYIKKPVQTIARAFIVVASAIAVISIVWEFYEIAIGIPIGENYVQDTTVDLIMGALGAFMGFVYYVRVHLVSTTIDTHNGTE